MLGTEVGSPEQVFSLMYGITGDTVYKISLAIVLFFSASSTTILETACRIDRTRTISVYYIFNTK